MTMMNSQLVCAIRSNWEFPFNRANGESTNIPLISQSPASHTRADDLKDTEGFWNHSVKSPDGYSIGAFTKMI